MIDAWSGLLIGCGVQLEVHSSGFLQRPVLLSLEDGDGGIVLNAGAPLPAQGAFAWRAEAAEVSVPMQQGQTGGGSEPRRLGAFLARGYPVMPGRQTHHRLQSDRATGRRPPFSRHSGGQKAPGRVGRGRGWIS